MGAIVDGGLLPGVRVLDLTSGIAGGYAGKLLADAGAEVVKIEAPGGDALRAGGDAVVFGYLQRGTRSVVLDLDAPGGAAALDDLASRADIVIEDTPPAGSIAPALCGAHPHLVVVSLSAFGLRGPWAARPSSDLVLQALSSSIAGRGDKQGRPVAAGGDLIEWATGATAAVAALIGLRDASSGGGDHIDLSRLEVAVTIFNGFRAVSGQLAPPPPDPVRVVEVPSIEPAGDGWVGFCTLSADQFTAFAELIGAPEWATDPDIRRIDVRCERALELRPRIAAWTSQHTVEEILRMAGERRIPAAPVGNGATGPSVAQLAERGVFRADLGNQPRIPYRLSRSSQPDFGEVPALGSTEASQLAADWPRRERRPRASAEGARSLPLEGIRVFDLTSYWAGPYVSQLLGMFGAEVYKVESVQRADGTRFGTSYGMAGERVWERAPLFQGVNTAKRGVTIDLSRPEGRGLGRRLLACCDVVIENYVPRVAEGFGILEDPRPDLIVVRMPAWGLSGPWRDRPGFAQTMEQVSGLAWVTGFPDGPPLIPRGPCDPIGGLHAAVAVVAAILERDRSGLGQLIEVPLVESALNVAASQFLHHAASGELLERMGNRRVGAVPHDVYPCRGQEEWVAVAVTSDAQWDALGRALGEPAWACDPRLATLEGRHEATAAIDAELARWCSARTADEASSVLCDAGVPAAPVVLPHAVVELAQLRQRAFWEEVEHPVVGRIRLASFPARFASRAGGYHRSPAPTLGQHNDEVLGGLLGLSAAELDDLEARQLIGTRPL